MGLFEKIFPKSDTKKELNRYFLTLGGYQPVFNSFAGGVYEAELCRAAVHTFATQISKLKPEIVGTAYGNLNHILQYQPNPWMDTTKFLYKLATILETENTAFIVPLYREDMQTVNGFYPIRPSMAEVREDKSGNPFLVFSFLNNGKKAALELENVGIMTKFFYKNDFFGEDNNALKPTMELINVQNTGIAEGVKQSASVRFIAKLANVLHSDDLNAEQARFREANLSSSNNGGVLMIDQKYEDVKPIESKPYIVDAGQIQQIKNNVFTYFNVTEKVIQNDFTDESWNAYYEGKIEPFALQLSLVLSNMLFTKREIACGNKVILTANRLQYASNETKLSIVTQLFDRGMLSLNEGLEIFNMAPVEGGDKRYIRKEYAEVEKLNEAQGLDNNGFEKGDENDDK